MKRLILAAATTAVLFAAFALAAGPDAPADTTQRPSDTVAAPDSLAADRIVVTYFHGTRRCATCMKLEAYSHEAITTGFPKDLADGCLEWRVINYDDKPNQHYADDYKLYSQSLILSHVVDGHEVAWENLDKIWELVGDKDKYIPYVQSMTRNFMNPPTKE